ncbi:acyl carrier protein [Mangrovibacterium lignilyticum]|uniref:acyl carrier protein n=1 Tax=Mangrovibacterium lignilyticum TaxID=2668052 RepID=UPI0013CF79AE|nr:acyl carrier protein [Mangrovibacterium lignilyticum]
METLLKVIAIIQANKENCLDVLPDTDLAEGLGIDSFDTLMIINAIEDEFSIEFDGKDLEQIKTVNDIAEILETKYLKLKKTT